MELFLRPITASQNITEALPRASGGLEGNFAALLSWEESAAAEGEARRGIPQPEALLPAFGALPVLLLVPSSPGTPEARALLPNVPEGLTPDSSGTNNTLLPMERLAGQPPLPGGTAQPDISLNPQARSAQAPFSAAIPFPSGLNNSTGKQEATGKAVSGQIMQEASKFLTAPPPLAQAGRDAIPGDLMGAPAPAREDPRRAQEQIGENALRLPVAAKQIEILPFAGKSALRAAAGNVLHDEGVFSGEATPSGMELPVSSAAPLERPAFDLFLNGRASEFFSAEEKSERLAGRLPPPSAFSENKEAGFRAAYAGFFDPGPSLSFSEINEPLPNAPPLQTARGAIPEPWMQIGRGLLGGIQNAAEKIFLALEPPHLGNICMELRREKEAIRATLWTESQATQAALESGQEQIQRIMEREGFRLEKFDVFVRPDLASFQERREAPLRESWMPVHEQGEGRKEREFIAADPLPLKKARSGIYGLDFLI